MYGPSPYMARHQWPSGHCISSGDVILAFRGSRTFARWTWYSWWQNVRNSGLFQCFCRANQQWISNRVIYIWRGTHPLGSAKTQQVSNLSHEHGVWYSWYFQVTDIQGDTPGAQLQQTQSSYHFQPQWVWRLIHEYEDPLWWYPR